MDKQQCYTRIEELERECQGLLQALDEKDSFIQKVYSNPIFKSINYHIENIEDLEDATIKELHRSINEL